MVSRFEKFYIKFKYGFRIKKPLLISRVIKNYFDVLFLGKRPIRYMDIAVDYKCNLKCVHCFATALEKDQDSPQLTVDDYKGLADKAIKLGVIHFSLQGGEILLHPELEEIIKAFKPNKSLISITTNATLLNKEKILKLKKLGVDTIIISLDSAIEEEHDKFRGVKGTFDKAIAGIKTSLDNGMNVIINTTVSHENLKSEGIQKLIEMVQDLKILLNVILAAPSGRWKGESDILVTEEDMKYIKELTQSSPYIRRDMDASYTWGCGAVKEALYISPYGDVLPCPFIHISLGNVLKEPLEKIRERGLTQEVFSSYPQKCLAAEDREFIKNYLSATFDKEKLPIEFSEVFEDK